MVHIRLFAALPVHFLQSWPLAGASPGRLLLAHVIGLLFALPSALCQAARGLMQECSELVSRIVVIARLSLFREELKQAAEQEKDTMKGFKAAVTKLSSKVKVAKQAATSARSAASSSSAAAGPRSAKRAKQSSNRPVSMSVHMTGLTAEVLQSLAPEGCHFAESTFKKAWRSWWTGAASHLGNRPRSWGRHVHSQAGRELLREVWSQWTSDTGEPCPLQWE